MFYLEQLLCSVEINAILFYVCKAYFDWLDITERQLAMQNAFSFGVFLISIRPYTESLVVCRWRAIVGKRKKKIKILYQYILCYVIIEKDIKAKKIIDLAVFGTPCPKKVGSVGRQQLFILLYFLFCLRLIFCFGNKTLYIM